MIEFLVIFTAIGLITVYAYCYYALKLQDEINKGMIEWMKCQESINREFLGLEPNIKSEDILKMFSKN